MHSSVEFLLCPPERISVGVELGWGPARDQGVTDVVLPPRSMSGGEEEQDEELPDETCGVLWAKGTAQGSLGPCRELQCGQGTGR